jgi:hypothetical protein
MGRQGLHPNATSSVTMNPWLIWRKNVVIFSGDVVRESRSKYEKVLFNIIFN